MERRKFIRNSFLTSAAAITIGPTIAIGGVGDLMISFTAESRGQGVTAENSLRFSAVLCSLR